MSKNVTELRFENGFILKSYDSFVAVKRNDGNHQVTGKWHSKTTSRHINEFFGGKKETEKAAIVPQSLLDQFGKFIEAHKNG